jgi:CTP:molybdopterin cytidylyltransferase MocA
MRQPKALLHADRQGTTFVRKLAATLSEGGCEDVLVVAGAHAAAVAADLIQTSVPVRMLFNPRWPDGQLSSLIVAIDAVDRPGVMGVIVALVDAPLVSSDTVTRLRRAHRDQGALVVRPARGGRHGHPVLFDRALFDELRHADPAEGAKAVLRRYAASVLDLPIADEGAYQDFDTPDDYRRLSATWQ